MDSIPISVADDHPPYATFEVRPVEDRTRSIQEGHPCFIDVDFVWITPAGTKDRILREAADWFTYLTLQVAGGRFKKQWLQEYKEQYDFWKRGQEAPLKGFPITDWPALTPAQVREFQGLQLRTVQDVASMNDEAMMRLGMGAQAFKQRAIEWLRSSQDVGKHAERLAALSLENETLRQNLARMQETLDALAAKVGAGRVPEPEAEKV